MSAKSDSTPTMSKEVRKRFKKKILQQVQYTDTEYKKEYAKGVKAFAVYLQGKIKKFIEEHKLKTKTPTQERLERFFDPDYPRVPYTKTCDIVCQFFWNESIEEWYDKEFLGTGQDYYSEYVPHPNWSGIIAYHDRYSRGEAVQDLHNRLGGLIQDNTLTASQKEMWCYGTHFYYSVRPNQESYLHLLEQGVHLKFYMNALNYNGSSLALDFVAAMFGTDQSNVHEEAKRGIHDLITLMKAWRNATNSDHTIFYETYAPQIEVKLHNRVVGYRGFFLCPDCPDAVSIVFPNIDAETSLNLTAWVGDNRAEGLAMKYFKGLRWLWDATDTNLTLQQFLQEGGNHHYYEEYPALLHDYFNC